VKRNWRPACRSVSRLPESVGVADDNDVLWWMRRCREAGHWSALQHRRHQLRRRRNQLHAARLLPLLRRHPILCAVCPILTQLRCDFQHYIMHAIVIAVSYFNRGRYWPCSYVTIAFCSHLSLSRFFTMNVWIFHVWNSFCDVAYSCRSRVSGSAWAEARLDRVPRRRRSAGCQRHLQRRLSVRGQRPGRRAVSNSHVYRLLLGWTSTGMQSLVYITRISHCRRCRLYCRHCLQWRNTFLRWPCLAKTWCIGLAHVRLSVCPVGILTITKQEAACDAASVNFGPTTRRTDIHVYVGSVLASQNLNLSGVFFINFVTFTRSSVRLWCLLCSPFWRYALRPKT